jgi:hypothetical protein
MHVDAVLIRALRGLCGLPLWPLVHILRDAQSFLHHREGSFVPLG